MGPADLARLTKDELEAVLRVVRQSMRRIERASRLGRGSDFDTFVAMRRQQAIEAEINRLEAELVRRARDAATAAMEVVADFDDQMLTEVGVPQTFGVDATVVARAQSTAAARVRGVTERMRRDLNQAVVGGVSGALDEDGFNDAIRRALPADAAEYRIERIIRTELGEVFVGQQATNDKRLIDAGIDLIKVWIHKGGGVMVRGARPDHVAVHGQERELWEPFNIGDGADADTPPGSVGFQAAAPLDPLLPPEHRINCGCLPVRRPRERAVRAYTGGHGFLRRPQGARRGACRGHPLRRVAQAIRRTPSSAECARAVRVHTATGGDARRQ